MCTPSPLPFGRPAVAAVAAAKHAYETVWKKTSFVERAAMLDKIADAIKVLSVA